MRIEYTPQINDDIVSEEPLEETDEISLHSEEITQLAPTMKPWPRVIGIAMIINGFFTAVLGVLELFVLPLLADPANEYAITFGKKNCYGAGLWAGCFMILTGSTAVRASISHRPTSVRKFFNLTLFTLLVYTGITVLLIVGYTLQWTDRDKYKEGSSLYEVHIFVTISTLFGFMFAIAAFIQYYEVIFCGEYNLCGRWFSCFLSCCTPQTTLKRSSTNSGSGESLPV